MKRFVILLFLTACFTIKAQQAMVLSRVKTETEINGILRSDTREVAEIELNPQSMDFTTNLSILTAFINDSTNSSPVYCVNIKAKFPVANFDTWTEEYVDKSYTMSALVSINGFSKQCNISFQLNRPNINRYSSDISNLTYYPGSISFRLGINPDDFNMDRANAVTKKNIVIEIAEGIINRNQDALNVAHCRN